MAPPDGRSITSLPLEIIDLILESMDQTMLKVCSRIASAFRYTSQRRLFSDLLLMRSRDRPHLTIDGFSKVLIHSPHLALYVRSLRIFEDSLFGPRPWIKSTELASILSTFVNLTKLSIDSQTKLDWSSLPPALLAALHDTIKLSTLTSIRIGNFSFNRSSQLVSLLKCSRSLEFLALSHVCVGRIDMIEVDAAAFASHLRLSSLDIDLSPRLMRSMLSVVDPQHLRFLRITPSFLENHVMFQRLLENAPHLNHCHFNCPITSFRSHTSDFSFRNLLQLRTLEFSFVFTRAGRTPAMCNWAAAILSGVPNPSPVQHVILNLNVSTNVPARRRSAGGVIRFIRFLSQLHRVLTAPPMAPLLRVTVRLDSYDSSHLKFCGKEQEIRDALPVLRDSGLLEVVLLEQT